MKWLCVEIERDFECETALKMVSYHTLARVFISVNIDSVDFVSLVFSV